MGHPSKARLTLHPAPRLDGRADGKLCSCCLPYGDSSEPSVKLVESVLRFYTKRMARDGRPDGSERRDRRRAADVVGHEV